MIARLAWIVIAVHAVALGCGNPPKDTPPRTPPPTLPAAAYSATIRWTSHGVPHVVADDLGGVAFGQGYAFATLHACVLADQIVKLRSERAKWFGPGDRDENIESDFGWLALGVREEARAAVPRLSEESRAVLRGFAAGYNRYLAVTPASALSVDCAGAPWLGAIDEVDLMMHWLQIGVIGSTAYFLSSIAAAQPPGTKSSQLPPAPDLRHADAPASNGWAIGAERSATGRGMVVANPHFPWEGELRFYESHLTVPGSLDVYGVTLLGLPLVSIGFTEHVAWTHTFSSSRRFVIYRLTLDAADPTRYRFGDETRALTSRELAIQVREPSGKLALAKRRTYRSHHGPIVANSQLAWDAQHAFALRDVAGGNIGALDEYLAISRARDLAAFEAAMARWQATGFVNTIAADRDGNALYVDGSAVPDLQPGALLALGFARKAMPIVGEAWRRGVVLADGSDPLFDFVTDPKSPRPGAIPHARAPRLARRDFVMNANDSYWLTNPAAPLTGFSPLYGEPGEPSARTRMNLRLLQADDKFELAELQAAILDNRAMTAELLLAEVVVRCKRGAARKPGDATLARACETLAAWDGRYDVGSRGAVLWRELVAALPAKYAVPFDVEHPLDTPRGLAPPPKTGDDPVLAAIGRATAQLAKAGVDPFGTLGAAQWVDKRGRKIAVPGSSSDEGSTNPAFYSPAHTTRLPHSQRPELVNADTGLARGGYPVNYGTSFLMAVGFTDAGPVARAVLTYSASSDPRSPLFTDQTELYSKKQWRAALFRTAEIEADPGYRVERVTAPRR